MVSTAAAGGFVLVLLSVPVIQGQNGWGVTYTSSEICAFKGSTVDIHCTYSHPNPSATAEKRFWFTKKQYGKFVDLRTDSDYTGRVQYDCDLDLQVQVTRSDPRTARAELKCLSSCPDDPPKLPSVSVSPSGQIVEGSSVTLTCSDDANAAANYTWYKENGSQQLQLLSEKTQLVFSSIQSSDSGEYQCAAENELGRNISQYILINVKYPPKLPSVSVSPSGQIVESSSVNLTCSSDANPAANYTWYKENQTLHHGMDSIYSFTSISSEDRGIYYCRSKNQYGQSNSTSLFIDVQYPPKLPSVSVSPSGQIVEGSSVNLTCSSDANPAANYTWYKENQTLLQGPGGSYNFTSISSEDRGIYYCRSKNQYGQSNSSLFIDVQYPPKLPSVSVSPS
ncbi:B-cell receptor CD22-like protein, partial [Lates japonicus]